VSTTTGDAIEAAGVKEPHGAEPGSREHPSDGVYIKVAVILGVIKAFEISLHYLKEDLTSEVVFPALLVLMAAKFFIVAGWFMHLRYDNPIYKQIFYFGLLLAIAVFLIMLTVFEFWTEGFWRFIRD
jgi:cytochrome c oxidase subunit 4